MLEYAYLLIYVNSDITTLLILFKGLFILFSFNGVYRMLHVLIPYTLFLTMFDSNMQG